MPTDDRTRRLLREVALCSLCWLYGAEVTQAQPLELAPIDTATSLAFELGGVQVNEPLHPLTGIQCGQSCVRPQDEVWAVNTRQSVSCSADGSPELKVFRYATSCGDWRQQTQQNFFATANDQAITLVYVHGNRVTPQRAIEQGWQVYRNAVACASNPRPVRFVVWSWPSTKARGLLHDLRSKADRTDIDGYALGRFLNQLPCGQQVSLVGFSYGSRIVTGAMHVAAGGTLNGRTLPDCLPRRSGGVRAVSLAGALGDGWLHPERRHGLATLSAERMLLVNNRRDPVLKRYHLVFGEKAVGFRGLGGHDPTGLVEQVDAARFIGESHDSKRYFASPELMSLVSEFAMWQ